jgi:hypothetical protein
MTRRLSTVFAGESPSYLTVMILDLTDEEKTALIRELDRIIEDDRLSDVAPHHDSKIDPGKIQTRTDSGAAATNQTLRAAAVHPGTATALDEIRAQPADEARKCCGCFGAIAPSPDASRPSPCWVDRVVPRMPVSG